MLEPKRQEGIDENICEAPCEFVPFILRQSEASHSLLAISDQRRLFTNRAEIQFNEFKRKCSIVGGQVVIS